MSIRKVSQGSVIRWEVFLSTGGRGSKQLRRRFDKKSDAEAFYEEWRDRQKQLKQAGGGTLRNFEETTLRAESDYWIERQGIRFSPGHLRRVKGVLEKLLPKFGGLAPNQFHPMRLSAYQSERLGQGVKPATVNRETDVITAILNFSTRHRRIPFSPASGFKKLPEIREDIQFWEKDEVLRFLKFADQKYPRGSKERWIYVVYLTAANTALRAGEIWGVKPKDLAHEGELLHIQRQFDLNVRAFRPPKGKRSRLVPCNEYLRREIMDLVEAGHIGLDQTIFSSGAGTPVDHDNFVDRIYMKDVKESGLKRIRFHDLRHTGTTLMLADGLNIKTVQEICGHKDISTTMKYVHLLGDSIRNAARTFSLVPEPSKPQLYLISSE